MKVLHIVQHLNIGGLEKMAVSLLEQSRFCNETRIAALEGDKDTCLSNWPQLKSLNDKLDFLEKRERFDYQAVNKLVDLIDTHNIRVVHSHHIGPMLYACLACLKRPDVQHVSTVHDAWYLSGIKSRFITKVLNTLSPVHWIADADVVAHDFYAQTSIRPQETILNGIDCKKFAPINRDYARYQLGLPKSAKIVGCAARLEFGKGHEDLIDALKTLPNNHHIVFAGQGSLDASLKAKVNSLKLESRVHFLGCVHNMEVFYSAIDVFCLFSQREGMPLTILEAMACGTPIVASDVGGIKEVLTQKQGVLLSRLQKQQIPNAIEKALMIEAGQAIRSHALSIAQIKDMSRKYDQLYCGITA
ncbi:D-inositol-3-phosphate glycosyltransferase [Pseudoalteromonas holothuriae]|uniref:D-inositol-3-phosphate glycosyltransferase n=1 Tax=Pseudoalteromonas holothuriae TaxID=2963714 RepID=A0ABM9GJW4_9GAMM|nr:glycosyltransferase [Pseudoalteromonas sp. CIP111951]CAH9061897.1 D-inositol-3-phosphate glycosyltransferase [Pseudoalteromonas sp. CIP111951]